jgi:hypothetical protein
LKLIFGIAIVLDFEIKNVLFISSFIFPPVSEANKDGILAIGGDLTPHAYN